MKIIAMLFLGLISSASMAAQGVIISQQCTFDQVEGMTVKRGGYEARECYSLEALPEVYATALNTQCAPTHREAEEVLNTCNVAHAKICELK